MKNLSLLIVLLFPILLSAQEGAYAGVLSLHISNKKAKILGFENSEGAYIARTIPNTPAEKAGLKSFDYLYAINGTDLSEEQDFGDILDELNPGDKAVFYLIRDGKKIKRTIKLAEKGHRDYEKRSREEDPFLGVSPKHNQIPKGINGVAVSIVECSTAEQMGLKNDDIITKIDGRPMFDFTDIHYAIDNRAVGDPIEVAYYRDGAEYELTQNIKSRAATLDCEGLVPMLENDATINEVATVDMEDVTAEESNAMKEEKGIDMPIVNNLSIEALQLFPNPTSGVFELKFDLPNNGITSIRLFDATAKLVYQRTLGLFSGNFSDQIDISNQTRGIYFLEIRQDELSLSKRLILQ